jgi:hypothetical protein
MQRTINRRLSARPLRYLGTREIRLSLRLPIGRLTPDWLIPLNWSRRVLLNQ